MKFSFSWLKDYLETNLSAEKVGDVLTDTGLEVESLINARKRLGHLSVGEVLKVDKHPNADKLKVCEVKSNTGILNIVCLLYTSPSPRDISGSRMPSSA